MPGLLRAKIVPVVLSVNGHAGITLWAPAWSDDTDTWQAFLGTDDAVLAFATVEQLSTHVEADDDGGGLGQHPSWRAVRRRSPHELRADHEDVVDIDAVPEIVNAAFNAAAVTEVAKAVQFATAIAEACDDRALYDFLTECNEYASLRNGYSYFSGRWGVNAWKALRAEVANSWAWISAQVADHIEWRGDTRSIDLDALTTSRGSAVSPWTASSYDNASPAGSTELLPGRGATIAITFFFGLFGVIPAVLATRRAQYAGVRTNRYWTAFWLTLVGSAVLWLLFVFVVVAIVASAA